MIFVTQTPDQTAPATAFFIQQQIGLDNDVVCFDVRLGCSGFSHGLYIAANMLQSMGEKKYYYAAVILLAVMLIMVICHSSL